MQKTSNLAARLKNQMQQDSEIIQDLTQKQLSTMRSELSDILQRELDTIKADIREQSETIGWSMFKSRFLWPALTGLSLCLGIFAGGYTAVSYYSDQILEMQESARILEKKGALIQFNKCGDQGILCVKIDTSKGKFGENSNWMIPEGY